MQISTAKLLVLKLTIMRWSKAANNCRWRQFSFYITSCAHTNCLFPAHLPYSHHSMPLSLAVLLVWNNFHHNQPCGIRFNAYIISTMQYLLSASNHSSKSVPPTASADISVHRLITQYIMIVITMCWSPRATLVVTLTKWNHRIGISPHRSMQLSQKVQQKIQNALLICLGFTLLPSTAVALMIMPEMHRRKK